MVNGLSPEESNRVTGLTFILSASILEKSKMSLMTVKSRSADTRIESAISDCSLDKRESFNSSELPITPLRGVRSS